VKAGKASSRSSSRTERPARYHRAVRGMGVQKSYERYVDFNRLNNSTHGLMAIQLAASEMEW